MKQYARHMFIKLLIMENPMTCGPCIFRVQLLLHLLLYIQLKKQSVDTFWCDIPTWTHSPARCVPAALAPTPIPCNKILSSKLVMHNYSNTIC